MLRNDYSLSSDANLGASHQDIHLDSASLSSSDSIEKRDAPSFKASSDLQHIIFLKLQEVSRQNLEGGFIDQALHGYERCTEQLLTILRGDTNSPTFREYLYATLNHLNDVALTFLRAGDIDNAIKILNKCLEISHPEPFKAHPDVQSLTFNHLGCCYRRMGDLDQALYCLQRAVHYHEKALEAGIQMNQTESSSITNINLCAVLSQMGNHKKALEHAKKAVVDCTRDFIHAPRRTSDILKSDAAKKKATMLAIAYYNLGVEEDFCKNPDNALEAYEKAFQFAEEHCGASDPVTLRFHQAYKEAKSKRKSISPTRCTSAKKLASPTSSTQVSFRAPPLSRPQSASNLKPRDVKLDLFTSPRSRTKLSLITNPSVQALDNTVTTPKYAQSVRSATAMLSKTLTSPTGGSHRRPPVAPTRGPKKSISRTSTANTKFFFPMGNRAPLFEPEKPKESTAGGQKPASAKPSRPNTANPRIKATPQEHRYNRPQSSKALFETLQGRRDFARSDGFETQYNSMEDVEDRRPVITITKPDFNNYKAFISPTNEGFSKFTLTQGNNESTKWTSAMGEMTEEAGFSFRRRGTISPKHGETQEDYRQKGKEIIEEVLKFGDPSMIIQKYWQGYKVRRALRRSGIEITGDKFWTGLNKIINRDFEENGVVGQYCVVMVYHIEEQKVYVEVKDLKTRMIYKGGVGYPLEKDEVKLICSKLLENIIIEDGRMAFKQKQIEEIKEDLMEQISEKSEESDVGPLIEALEKQMEEEVNEEDMEIGEDLQSQKREDSHKIEESETSHLIKLERFNTNETQEMSSKRGETSKRGSTSKRGDMSQLDPEESLLKESLVKKKSLEKTKSINEDNKDPENIQSKRSKATSSYTDIEESSSKGSKLLLFTKRAIVKGHLVSFRLESHTNMRRKTRLILSCFDSVNPSKIEIVELPLQLSEKKDITVSDLLEYVTIEFEPFKLTLQSVRQEAKVNQDSFSSHDNASIICDISGSHQQDMRASGLLRSRSLGKQQSLEDHSQFKNYKAYNSTILDGQNQEREAPQFLGVNSATRTRVPKLLPVEEKKNFSLGLALKVPEVSSGREYSSQDIPIKKTLRDSRTSVSQGASSQRSEAEGSMMLRMTEGVVLYCRVAYKRGETDAIIKYSLTGSESNEFEELRTSLEELGLDAASDIDKDVLLEKIRSLLGKRMKYRNGTVVYEKKSVSRQETMPSGSGGEDTRDTSRKKQRNSKDDSEGKIDKQETSGNIPILNKIEEDEEEWQRRPTESDVLKTTKGTQDMSKINKNHILIAEEDRKRATDSPKITLRKATAGPDSLDSPMSSRSGRSNRSGRSQPNSGVFGQGEIGNLQSLLKPVVGSPSLRKDLGGFSEEVAMIETFGVLHTTESSSEEKTLRGVQPNRQRAVTTEEKSGALKLKKRPSVEDLMAKNPQGKTLKPRTSKETLSPKKVYGGPANNLRPPDNRRGEDSSPKVRSNFMVRVSETNSAGSPTQSVWSSLMEHASEAEERREGTNSRGSILKSPRSFAGDIPKIVIHGEKGKSKVMDFHPKTMSLGMLEEDKNQETPGKKKTLQHGFSMGANDGKEEAVIEQQQQSHDWEKLKAIQNKQQERRNKVKF